MLWYLLTACLDELFPENGEGTAAVACEACPVPVVCADPVIVLILSKSIELNTRSQSYSVCGVCIIIHTHTMYIDTGKEKNRVKMISRKINQCIYKMYIPLCMMTCVKIKRQVNVQIKIEFKRKKIKD